MPPSFFDNKPPRDAGEAEPASIPTAPWLLRVYLRWVRETSFRKHLNTAVALGALTLALLTALANAWQAGQQVRSMLLDQGGRVAVNLASSSSLALVYAAADNAEEAVRASLAYPDVTGVEIYDARGGLLLARGAPAGGVVVAPSDNKAGQASWLDSETASTWAFAAPVWTKTEASPFDVSTKSAQLLGHVRIIQSKETLRRAQTSLFISNFGVALIVAVVFLFAVRYLVAWLTRPLAGLFDAIKKLEQGAIGFRAPEEGPQDIAVMAHSFNRMVAALQERDAELAAHRSHLEDSVRERTLELSAAKERAEMASRVKSQFLARMSHELRTPLNAVMSYAQIARAEGGLSKVQLDCMDVIHSSGEQLLTLIVDILDFSRIETGKTELSLAPVELPAQLQSVANHVRGMAQDKGLELRVELDTALPRWIQTDERRLRQILINLLNNAVRFTNAGHVMLSAAVVASSDTLPNEVKLRFEVQDTGVGIAEGQAERLFEPFEQAGSIEQRGTGTGLGLATSRHLVKMLGGELQLKSQVGVGSTLSFEIQAPVQP